MEIQAVLLRNQIPSVLLDVVDTNSAAGISVAVGCVVDRTAAEFCKE